MGTSSSLGATRNWLFLCAGNRLSIGPFHWEGNAFPYRKSAPRRRGAFARRVPFPLVKGGEVNVETLKRERTQVRKCLYLASFRVFSG
jgi:hypothetical protein